MVPATALSGVFQHSVKMKGSPMEHNRFDVIVVGGGPAGITAAAALGRQGFSVLVCEAAVYPGAENWSGAVYFTENLEAEDAFGRQAIEQAPFERRLAERGFYMYNGHSLLGATMRDESVFRSCYTVLRPVFDRYLAELAREHGVVLANETTVQSLIRHAGRVVGVHTERGPAYADVVFLAEGDASHLVTQEGYERVGRDARRGAGDSRRGAGDAEAGGEAAAEGAGSGPHFLQGVKEVVSLPPHIIEERFGLQAGAGGAYEMLLRNGSRDGRTIRLNMGGFIYTNRDSVSLGLVLPVDNLAREFDGDHNLLMEWFKGLPEVARWIEGGEVTSYGTKIIRSGGIREIPRMVDDGLAIGGAASGIGIDFPYPNFTGPATSMGLLFARAVAGIAADNGGPGRGAAKGKIGAGPFTGAALEASYLKQVKETHYYRNVERLADWPEYIERTRFFFGRQLDLINGAAYLLSRPDVSAPRRWWDALRLRRQVIGGQVGDFVRDMSGSAKALGLGRAAAAGIGAGTLAKWIGNTITAILPGGKATIGGDDQTGVAEAPSPGGGRFRVVFRVLAGAEKPGRMPLLARWYWRRFGPALAGAFADVYTNDDEPLDGKLPRALGRLIGQLSIWDPIVDLLGMVVFLPMLALQAITDRLGGSGVAANGGAAAKGDATLGRLLSDNRDRLRLDDDAVRITTSYDHKLGTIRYHEGESSHIRVMWPDDLADRQELASSSLWSVCPAKVYEVQRHPMGMPGVVVNFDNCVKCETCWRATDDVHWSRATRHRLIYETYTPAHAELRDYLMNRQQPAPRLLSADPFWDDFWGGVPSPIVDPAEGSLLAASAAELARFAAAIDGYGRAVAATPLTMDGGERRYLRDLARIAARRFAGARTLWEEAAVSSTVERAGELWADAAARVDEVCAHADAERFLWADVVGSQLRDHHLAGFAVLFDRLGVEAPDATSPPLLAADTTSPPLEAADTTLSPLAASMARAWGSAWIHAEGLPARYDGERERIRQWCDDHIDSPTLRMLEEGRPPGEELRSWLADQLAAAASDGRHTSAGAGVAGGYGLRDVLLEELAAVDPSLAAIGAQHLLAVDCLQGAQIEGDLGAALREGRLLATVVTQGSIGNRPIGAAGALEGDTSAAVGSGAELHGDAPFVLAGSADWMLVVRDNLGYLVPVDDPGVSLDDVGSIGLIGAGVRRVAFDGCVVPAGRVFEIESVASGSAFTAPAAGEPFADTLQLAVGDLLAIVRGVGAYLTERAREHAGSRVQFPGGFQDEAGRDTIAKFGAVKQMLAEMEAQRILVESLSMIDPCAEDPWLGAAVRKVAAADAFGPRSGSLSYNCGQVFGGTAFSEDDCIAKYYRDASPFRFLAAHDDALRAEIGRRRLDAVRAGGNLVPLSAEETAWLAASRTEEPLSSAVRQWDAARQQIESWANAIASEPRSADLEQLVQFQSGELVCRALAAKVSILRAAWRLESGLVAEATTTAAALWADRLVADAPAMIGDAGLLAEVLDVGSSALAEGEFEPGARIADAESYEVILASDHAAQSGEWLHRSFDPERPRYIPETTWNDPALREFRCRLEAELRPRYVGARFDGLTYNRYLEKLHIVPDEDLSYLVDRGYMRMPIPAAYGGEEAFKAMYYIVCEMTSRYGDSALSLAIMANTSIGTTPMMIGLKQDLPRARKELEKVKEDPSILGDIRGGLDALIAALGGDSSGGSGGSNGGGNGGGNGGRVVSAANADRLQRDYLELSKLVKQRIAKSSVLKYIGAGFLRAFFAAGKAGQKDDLDRFGAKLREAREAIGGILGGVEDRLVEYPRRERGHELCLKMISAGYISAFALTEPTAGSDSGGVKTSARPERRRVHEDESGVLYFYLDEENADERRNLLDADRVEFDFDSNKMLYRWSDEHPASEIRHDEYDYEKDRPGHWRTYEHAGAKTLFTDIAQIRTGADGVRWYEFWELNGAKMWITNGRFCHIMALYAKTEPEGVTGFMVDRHAEGMVVGSDEEKLGQRGSPTNELSLTGVRVPREWIIGFRGRGQVNALETLNTGRTGLSVAGRAAIQEMMEDAVGFIGEAGQTIGDADDVGAAAGNLVGADGASQQEGGEAAGSPYPRQATAPTPLQRYWTGRLMEELVATAAVAHELVGLFDHPLTKDVRMESAIGKYYNSEAEHDGIEWMERLRGLDGLTHRHRIEKTRRDARVVNIYEGTNEIQRYLLLRDLAQRVLPAWRAAEDTAPAGGPTGAFPELSEKLESIKHDLMSRLDAADKQLGALVWANVNLQPCFFRLAEIAGLIKVMDAMLYRLEWIASRQVPDRYRERLSAASILSFERCALRAEALGRRYAASYGYLADGRYPPDVTLGFLALDPQGAAAECRGLLPDALRPDVAPEPLAGDVRIAVMVKPVPVVAPRPRLGEGSFEESLYALDAVDLRSLDMALALKSRDPERVTVAAYAFAGAAATDALRQAVALGADEVHRIDPPGGAEVMHDSSAVARVMARCVEQQPAELVLCGAAASDTSQGGVAPILSGLLGVEHIERAHDAAWGSESDRATEVGAADTSPRLRVTAAGWQGHRLEVDFPCVVSVDPPTEEVESITGLGELVSASTAQPTVAAIEELGVTVEHMPVSHRPRPVPAGDEGAQIATTPEAAAAVLLQVAGLSETAGSTDVEPYRGDPAGFGQQPDDPSRTCMFVCDPATTGELAADVPSALDAAARFAKGTGLPLDVVLPLADPELLPQVAGRMIAEIEPRRLYVIQNPGLTGFGPRGHLEWLQELWGMYRGEVSWLLGPDGLSNLLARFAGQGPPGVNRCSPWLHVQTVSNGGGAIRLGSNIFDGAGQIVAVPPDGGLRIATFAPDAEVELSDRGRSVAEPTQVFLYEPRIEYDVATDRVAALLHELGGGELTLADAEFVVDFGYGAGGREGLEELAEPLLALLVDELGLTKSMIGATRKVTQDLEVLPMDRQIGQTGTRVDPKVMVALAVSGAPQHIDWVGDGAVVLSFNKDPDAPLMRLNDQRARPVVHPIVGDVRETIPRFIAALREQAGVDAD